jgi:hypothetical protein
LDATGPDEAALARRVAVGDLSTVDNGDGLEPAMRVRADAARLVGGREIGRTDVIEQ